MSPPASIFSWIFVLYAILGVCLQMAVIYLVRAKDFSFFLLAPLILLTQWLFITAYAKAPNFTAQWFLTTALSGILSVVFGAVLFGDGFGWQQYLGVFVTMIGLSLLMCR